MPNTIIKRPKYNSLTEYYARNTGLGYNTRINDPDAYKFATGILMDMCMKYIQYAFWCKAKVSPVKSRNDNGLHRAAFNATLISLESDKSQDKHKVLCKIYNKEKDNDCVAIDYNAIVDGYYDLFASVIDNTVYYLHIGSIYRYQEAMGNACISKSGKYINIAADYFINYAQASYEMKPEDIAKYNAEYNKYIKKSVSGNYVGESKKNKNIAQLLEGIRTVTGINDKLFDKAVLNILKESKLF